MKKTILFLSLLILTLSSFSQKPLYKRKHPLNKTISEVAAFPGFKTAGFSFYAIDLSSGEIIAQLNPDKVLKPASTLKLLTTASALELMGSDFQFETTLEYSGEIDTVKHLITGNIIINGGGDPALGSKYFDSTKDRQFLNEWVNAIKKLGVDSVRGRVISDARMFSWQMVPPSWSWQNMGNYYGAGPCGLSIFDNTYALIFNTGKQVGDTAEIVKTVPKIPRLVFDNSVTADSITYDNAYIFGAPYSNKRSVRGQLPLNKVHFPVKGSMPDPAFVAAFTLDSLLKENGIRMGGSPSTKRLQSDKQEKVCLLREFVLGTLSPPLGEIIKQTNTESINLFAEHLLIHAGLQLGAVPQTTVAADSVRHFWKKKGMDTDGLSLNDGSGLSQYNAISPKQMVFVLQYMKNNSLYFDSFYNSLPVAGKTGTLEEMFKGSIAEGKLRAKSGTIAGVRAYAGYVTTESGREVAFSIAVNNFSCSSPDARDKLEQLMIAVAEFDK